MSLKKNRFYHFRNVHARLVLGYVSVFFVSIIIILSYLYTYLNYWLIQTSKKYVYSDINSAVELISKESFDKNSLNDFIYRQIVAHKGPNRLRYALFDQQGYLISKSDGLRENQSIIKQFDQNKDGYTLEQVVRNREGHKNYVLTRQLADVNGEIYYLQLEIDPYNSREIMRKLLIIFTFAIPLILLLTVFGGYFLTKRLLSPIKNIIQSVKRVSLTDTKAVLLPIRNTDDEFDQLSHTFNDMFQKLRESYQRIITFTANASHELRLPITAIKGAAEVVLERERDIGQYKKVLEDTVEEINRLSQMLSQLLVLTRADSNADMSVFKEVDLVELLHSLKEFYSVLGEEKNIPIIMESQKESIIIEADARKLQQLFSNLIENAVKYTPENGRIEMIVDDTGNECTIRIKDTGIGIPEDKHKKIFERFYRIEKSRSREYGGAGLGLSIVEIVINEHNGRIIVESEPNNGSCFKVTLPKRRN